MPENNGTQSRQVTWFWAALWLVAALVIGINATVVLHQYRVVPDEPTVKLAGMLLIGELLLYFVVLMLPGERIVPPGRTILVVIGAVGARLLMAVIAAQMAILAGDTTSFSQLWRIMHGSFWLGALLQMLLIAIYLWLVRSALEIPRRRAKGYRRPAPTDQQHDAGHTHTRPTDEQIRQRQEQLLSALMENPDAPVEAPISHDARTVQSPPPSPTLSPEQTVATDSHHLPPVIHPAPEPDTTPPAAVEPPAPVATDTPTVPADQGMHPDPEDVPTVTQDTDSLPPVPDVPTVVTTPAQMGTPVAPVARPEEPSQPEHMQMEPTQSAPAQPIQQIAEDEDVVTFIAQQQMRLDQVEPPVDTAAQQQTAIPPSAVLESATGTEPAIAPDEAVTVSEAPAVLAATPSPEQDFVLRNALNRVVPGQTVETAVSSSGRVYALVGLSSEFAAESLTQALDELLASVQSAAAAMRATPAGTALIMSEQATLVTATSADCGSQVVIQSSPDSKLGQLTLLGRRAAQVASDVHLGNQCPPLETQLRELTHDLAWCAPEAGQLSHPLEAFAGASGTVLTTAIGADAPAIAGTAEQLYQAAATVAEALQIGAVDRVLVEGTGAGLVLGALDVPASGLLVLPADTTGKMGAANVAMGKIRDALRGEG